MMNFLSAIPYFWLVLLSLYLFSYLLNWFPLSGGYDSANIDPGRSLDFISSVVQYAFLPALTLVISSLAGWMLTMRNSMITTLSEDYVLMARAKGLSTGRRVRRRTLVVVCPSWRLYRHSGRRPVTHQLRHRRNRRPASAA